MTLEERVARLELLTEDFMQIWNIKVKDERKEDFEAAVARRVADQKSTQTT